MGRQEGVGGSRIVWKAKGGLKQPFRLKEQCCAFSAVPSVCDIIHKGGQDWHEEQFDTPSSPINAPQDHEMYPHDFIDKKPSRLAILSLVLDASG